MANKWRIGLRDNGKRAWVEFPYSDEYKDLLKERVSGIRWDAKAKLWHAPLDMDTLKDIHSVAKYFGEKLMVEAELASWIKKEKDRYANLIKPDDFSADTSQWLPRLRSERPALVAAMESQPHQIPGTAFMVGQRSVLLADDPGAGKTIQTLAAVAEKDVRGPILVVAPRSAVNVTWPEEIEKWLGKDEVIFRINGAMKPDERKITLRAILEHSKDRPHDRLWVLCGPNYLRIRADLDDYGNYERDAKGNKIIRTVNEGLADLFRIKWACVIVDESHQTLAGSTGNKKKQSAQRQGLGALELRDNALQIAISGTPFRGKTENLWGTLNWLYPDKYTSYWNWVRRHYGVYATDSRYGSGIGKGEVIIDEKRFYAELKPLMIRRTKAEIAPWLPAKKYGGTHLKVATGERSYSEVPAGLQGNDRDKWMLENFGPVAVWLPMSEKQSKQYDEITASAMLSIDEMGETINVNGVLAEMTRMKQVANACLGSNPSARGGVSPILPSNKIEWIEDFLNDRIAAGTKTIVASQFTGFIELLSNHLDKKKIKHYTLTGKTSDAERTYIRKHFQDEGNNEEMVILLNTKAGGVSLTLDLADDVVICDQTWIPDDQQQVEDRAHRVSRNHNVTIWYLASLGTLDEDIARTNAGREDAARSVLDQQRGVSYVRELISLTKKRQSGKIIA
ncbi:helicase [Mycobacterium phage Madruga]|uniref:Helicase n=1 Tax=Mycobacterium phage Madruga TaxID=1675552 RepID=A0A0K1LSB0_9CAUD|nr:helicase [Mycobacterium phage Madruga]